MTDQPAGLKIPLKVLRRREMLSGRATEPMSADAFREIVRKANAVNAPLDGYSDTAWRTVCIRKGAAFGFTEMVPAIALVYGANDAIRRLKRATDETILAVQIEGSRPDIMAEAARISVDAGADIIDINAGCPSPRVTNSGAGSALLADLPLLATIAAAVKSAVKVPVTLKVRSGPVKDRITVSETAAMVNDLDLAAVTLHPRTRSQMYRGSAEWDWIRVMKELCRVPVIGNGDIRSAADAVRMYGTTGCDSVMIARGAIGNPWIFNDINAAMTGRDTVSVDRTEWIQTVWEHFDLMVQCHEGDESLAARLFRKHLSRYTRGMAGSSAFRRSLAGIDSRAALRDGLENLLHEEERAGGFVYPMPRPDDTF